MMMPFVELLNNLQGEQLIEEITKIWDRQKYVIVLIKDILLYMDKNFVPKMRNYPNIENMQTIQFRTHVVANKNIKDKVIS